MSELSDTLIELAPDRESILRIIDAEVQRTSNRESVILSICSSYGEKLKDYGVDPCVVEAAIMRNLSKDLRTAAQAVLPQIQTPALNSARLNVLVQARFEEKRQDKELIALHIAELDHHSDPTTYLRQARRIAYIEASDDYFEEASQRLAKQ